MRHAFRHGWTYSRRGLWCSVCRRFLDEDVWLSPAKLRAEEMSVARRVRRPGETLQQAFDRWYKKGLPAAKKLVNKAGRREPIRLVR